ncbi:MAG: hypothetical protein KAU26_10040 [Methylococcales bacterium]|nr:hypothetical protein [Methylococcales bacterium]
MACDQEERTDKTNNPAPTTQMKPISPKVIKSPVMMETKLYQPEVDEQGYIQLTEDKTLIDQETGLLEKSRIETESQINQLIHQLNDHLDNSKEREKIQQELNQLTQSYKQNVLALAKHQMRLQSP